MGARLFIPPIAAYALVMSPTVYLDGQYASRDQALISPLDRGFLFADGVYEVVRYYGGRPLAMAEHTRRMADSLAMVRITYPDDLEPLPRVSERLVEANACPDCYVYWQVTRGVAERDHRFPDPPVRPTIFAFAKPMGPLPPRVDLQPMTAITHPDIRWQRCAIKSVALLPNVLARQAAADAGADEAILVNADGHVTEGTARSVLAVFRGRVHTHPLDGSILGSITRRLVLMLAEDADIEVVEQAFTAEQLLAADEVMVAGTTTEVRPVSTVDGSSIGDREVGPVTRRLAEALHAYTRRECGLASIES